MKILNGKWRYVGRMIIMVTLFALGIHSCNVAIYSVWQSAFPEKASYLSQLELRFWLFGIVAVAAFLSGISLLMKIIKMLNSEKKNLKD